MHSSESDEHKKIKALISERLKDWTGAALQEYPSSGHESDVFAITPDGISIYVEIIWSDSLQNFYRDMTMIQASDADVKLVVVSSGVLNKGKCQREFEKVAISQRKFGFAMYGDLIDGNRIIGDQNFLETDFKKIVMELLAYVQKHGKIVGKQAEFSLPAPKLFDKIEEHLLSNLFPVKEYPPTIFSSPTTVRRVADVYAKLGPDIAEHAFLSKNKRLYVFDNLRDPSSHFLSIIDPSQVTEDQSSEWFHDSVKRNDLIYLLNLVLEKYCTRKRDMYYDRYHDRFVCLLQDGKDNIFRWRAGSKHVQRRLARRVCGKDRNLLFCIHYAASLKFISINGGLFLKIEPTKTFTSDGFNPIRIERLASLMGRYLSKEYNSAYLSLVRFWAKYLSRLDVDIRIPAGEGVVRIDTNPCGALVTVGIATEKVA